MVVVEYTYEEMRGLIDLPQDEMINSLSDLGAPSEYEPETKKILTELTPNRPDWYSMEGLARALRAYHGEGHPQYSAEESDYEVIVDPSVEGIRPYTVCAVVKGLALDDQRIRDMVLLQEKLLGTLGRKVKRFGLGIYPLQEIGFPVTYTTMRPGDIRYVPLGHDKEMDAREIIKEHKKGQQYGYLIQDFERYPVFLDSKKRVMALIPVVNSAQTGKVDESTKDIFIEVTGNDIHSCKAALNILVCTFADMGGRISKVKVAYEKESISTPDLSQKEIRMDVATVNQVLGLSLTEEEAADLLTRMGYGFRGTRVYVPPYRADVLGIVDIIEDVAIAYGYNNFEPTMPDFFSEGKLLREHGTLDAVMRGMGFLEIKTFILTNEDKIKDIGHVGEVVGISNPCSQEFTVVRPSLLADMLDAFVTNKMKGLPQRFYEIGLVQDENGTGRRLAFGLMDREVDFSDARGYLQTLAREAGFGFSLEKRENAFLDKDTSCAIVSGGQEKGVFGRVSQEMLDKYGLGFQVFVCELKV